jgi:hypothetical protein
MDGSSCVWTVDQLRHHVHDTLCRQENLVAQQFELQTIALTRLGVRCGLQRTPQRTPGSRLDSRSKSDLLLQRPRRAIPEATAGTRGRF